MSTNKFANVSRNKTKPAKPDPALSAPSPAPATKENTQKGARTGKKAVSAYFSPELSRALKNLANEQDQTVQAMLGEAIDDLMKKYRKLPFGER